MRGPDGPVVRVVVVAPAGCALGEGRDALVLALRSAGALVGTRRPQLTVVADGVLGDCRALVRVQLGVEPTIVTDRRPSDVLAGLRSGDLLVLPSPVGGAGGGELAARVLRQVPPEAAVVVALARGRGPRTIDLTAADRRRPVPSDRHRRPVRPPSGAPMWRARGR